MSKALLPEHWHLSPLEKVASIQTGIAKGKTVNGCGVTLPYLRVANVQDGHVDLSVIKEITVEQSDVLRYSLRDGDVLFTEGGDFDKLGRGTVWHNEISPCLHQNHVFAVRPKAAVLLPEFLAFQAASRYGRRYFQGSSKQSTNLASINSTQLKNFPVLEAPIEEQRKIVAVLRTWDEAVDKCEQIVQIVVERRNALSSRLLSEARLKSSTIEFGDILKESRIAGSDGASARKITVKLYGKGAIEKSENYSGSRNTRYYIRKKGQLIYSKLDFLNGAFAIIPDSLDGFETTLDLPAFDISPNVNPAWLIEYLTRPSYYTKQVSLARGQRKARRVSPEEFLNSKVRLPDRKHQDKLAKILSDADTEILLAKERQDALSRQKRGLMQKLLTGEWRVKL